MTLPGDDKDTACFTDFRHYSRRCLKIQTMEGVLSPFALNEPQLFLERIVMDIKEMGLPVRLVVLKARREGVSTWTEGRFYWHTSTKFNRYAVTVTHEPEATDFIFKMTKRFHANVPDKLRPATKYSNSKLLEFNTPDGLGLDSAFRVGTAEKEDFGSGQLVHFLHLSEVCKWPKATQTALLTSLLQCVPDELDTEVVLESTAKGIGGEFYSRFNGARRKYDVRLKEGKPTLYKTINEDANAENSYCSVFLPWFVFDKYRKEPPGNFVLTVEEEDIKRLYGLTDAHIYWRRWAIENRCNGDVDTFMQEYPSNPMECFLATGRPVFDMKKLLALKAALPKPKIRYELMFNRWTQSPEGRLKVWNEPLAGRAYIVAADVAEGLVKGDFSVADVIDHLTGEQVAHWHGHIDPDEFGRVLYWLGTKYNTALIVPERNNHGLTTVTTLNTMKYHRLYAEMVAEPPSKTRKRFGWATTTKTRPLIIDTLIALVREGFHGLRCAETVGEMMGFKIQDDGKMEADEGLHDDRVISYAIAQHIRKMNPAPRSSMSVAPSASRPGSINVSKMPSGAWT